MRDSLHTDWLILSRGLIHASYNSQRRPKQMTVRRLLLTINCASFNKKYIFVFFFPLYRENTTFVMTPATKWIFRPSRVKINKLWSCKTAIADVKKLLGTLTKPAIVAWFCSKQGHRSFP